MDIWSILENKIKGKNITIVYPESNDERILGAAARHAKDGLLVPVLVGEVEATKALAKEKGIDLGDIEIIDPKTYADFDTMVASFVERRKGKVDEEKARTMLLDPNYFGTMLVYMGKADGMVSGAVHSTGDTVRPALQIVKMAPGASRVSGAMVMIKGEERYLFSDVAINITTDAQAMGEIAVVSAATAKTFGIEPKVALLSFSTMGSAVSPESTKVAEATEIAKNLAPELALDGELQFDAAFVEKVAKQKAPNSTVAGHANVFIFPSLEAGNIGYKIAQRLGGFEALGPILQGLAKPINDLSRGCNEEDAYRLAIITAAQASEA
jgi:phosphate acetyltransferase